MHDFEKKCLRDFAKLGAVVTVILCFIAPIVLYSVGCNPSFAGGCPAHHVSNAVVTGIFGQYCNQLQTECAVITITFNRYDATPCAAQFKHYDGQYYDLTHYKKKYTVGAGVKVATKSGTIVIGNKTTTTAADGTVTTTTIYVETNLCLIGGVGSFYKAWQAGVGMSSIDAGVVVLAVLGTLGTVCCCFCIKKLEERRKAAAVYEEWRKNELEKQRVANMKHQEKKDEQTKEAQKKIDEIKEWRKMEHAKLQEENRKHREEKDLAKEKEEQRKKSEPSGEHSPYVADKVASGNNAEKKCEESGEEDDGYSNLAAPPRYMDSWMQTGSPAKLPCPSFSADSTSEDEL